MDRFQLYALDQVLSEYPDDMDYFEILAYLRNGGHEDIVTTEEYGYSSNEDAADSIEKICRDVQDWFTDPDTISINWSIFDVKDQADRDGLFVSSREAQQILQMLKQNHNPEVGINWNVVSDTIAIFKDSIRDA